MPSSGQQLIAFLALCSMTFPHTDSVSARTAVKTHSLVIPKTETFEGIKFPPNSRFEIMENGRVYYAWPGEELEANGIKIQKGTQLMLQGNGKVQSLWTVPQQKILDVVLPAKTWVTFKKDGSVDDFMLEAPFRMRNLDLVGHVEFYRNGSFKKATLSHDQAVDGISLRKGEVSFHSNAKIMHGVLSKPARIRARQENGTVYTTDFDADMRIYVDETGVLVGAFPVGRNAGTVRFAKELHPSAED
jgi:hypothetical protein